MTYNNDTNDTDLKIYVLFTLTSALCLQSCCHLQGIFTLLLLHSFQVSLSEMRNFIIHIVE